MVWVKEDAKPGAKSSNGGSDSDGSMSSRAQSVPCLDPGKGLFRAKSPQPLGPTQPSSRVHSPSPPRVRSPVKVPERFKSLEPELRMPERHKSPEPSRAPMSPEPVLNGESKHNVAVNGSAINGSANGNVKPPGASISQPDLTDDQGLIRKKVVKVVRRVVRKVLPTEEEDARRPTGHAQTPSSKMLMEPPKPAAAPASVPKGPKVPSFSFKHDTIKTEDKDDISAGLTSLMGRGRTREPRPRTRKDEPPEKAAQVEKKEKEDIKDSPKISEVKPEPKEEEPVLKREAPVSSVPTTAATIAPPNSSAAGFIPAPKSSTLSPPAGFVPAPKSSPLSPPVGFVPAPKSSPLSPPVGFVPAPKSSPLSPPVGFVPPPKSSPISPSADSEPAPKTSPLSAPAGFVPPPKSVPLSPPKGFVPTLKTSIATPPSNSTLSPKSSTVIPPSSTPVPKSLPPSLPAGPPKSTPISPPTGFVPPPPKTDPFAPPPGFIPAPKQLPVTKTEEEPLSPTEEAQRRLERIFTAPVMTAPNHLELVVTAPALPSQAPASVSSAPPQVLWPSGAPSGVLAGVCARVACWSGQVDEDPVAILQASHAAAQQPKVGPVPAWLCVIHHPRLRHLTPTPPPPPPPLPCSRGRFTFIPSAHDGRLLVGKWRKQANH
ncbi:uncharacterized protein [Osmerus mordax]|uniref:uncharacterized protein n=1 Tax=Osmerus mordax TaxID=8014 RepID=UPI00350EA327